MQALLISDLHLSPDRPEITEAFVRFLQQQATQARSLYILGDLFEAWVGDDDPSQLALTTKAALKQLAGKNTKIYFQHGNRDFLVGKQFSKQTGVTILPDHHVVTLSGQKTLLMHGDTLCTDDVEYQRFRKKSRNPLFKFVLRNLPLKKRQKIASDWRSKSKMANANKPDNIMDASVTEVERVMEMHGVSRIIHGHTHRPATHQHQAGTRIVLGDWTTTGWYVQAENDNIELIEFQL